MAKSNKLKKRGKKGSKDSSMGDPTTTTKSTTTTTTTKNKNSFDDESKNSETKPSYEILRCKRDFLTEKDGRAFEDLVRDHYGGFVHVPAEDFSGLVENFQEHARASLERLRDANYYQYDVVMAGGKHSSRTFVKRTLVGEPGITYKYLGLRLFAHAWSGPNCPPCMRAIGELNRRMIAATRRYPSRGKFDYNLTLINFMEPSSHSKVGFKDEAFYGMGKVSVSWHADSSLEPNSSIGVYHCLPTQRAAKWDWRIALRKNPGNEATTSAVAGTRAKQEPLPIAMSTKDGDAYFLLGTFNETHQHCVLSGSEAHRISSTHRCAVTKEDTHEYIHKRARGAVKRFKALLALPASEMDPKVLVFCQRVLTEVETDWIAQYWLQGAAHDQQHVWWQKPIRALEGLWGILEGMTHELYHRCLLRDGPQQKEEAVPRLALKGFLLELERRRSLREQWDDRRADKIYQRRISPPYRPVERPLFPSTGEALEGRLPKDLADAIAKLTAVREKQLVRASLKNSGSKTTGVGGKRKGAVLKAAKPSHKKKHKR